MKRLITLILLAPALASAACLPTQVCVATSGTAVVNFEFPFDFAGKGFSASGALTNFGNFDSPFTVTFLERGSFYDASISGTTVDLLTQFELTVNGVPWGIPAGGGASVNFPTTLYVNGASLITQPFGFEGSFTGAPEPFAPGLGCDVLNCETLNFRGVGIVTYDVGGASSPTIFGVQQETFTFTAPEPSIASLLSIAFAGLAVMGRRRVSRTI